MIAAYLDSSVLVSLYVPESTTAAAESLVAGIDDPVISHLGLLETQVAMERKRKVGAFPDAAIVLVRERIEADIACHRLTVVAVESDDFRAADALNRKATSPLRSLDALHAAMANRLGLRLITLDKRLAQAAVETGLVVSWRDPDLPTHL